ncbi:hypothetical protein BC834DRAFT_828753 [Gloeopeniophorella convolvens]|nr:hypothetical protein BC834DRAFT_828753 [Gloeopeniophorella convolvens]
MGVHGLTTYLRENQRALSSSLTLSQEESASGAAIPLVVDGWSFIYEVNNQSRLPWVYGGELKEFHDLVVRITQSWISVGFRPHFVFDGPYPPSKFATGTLRVTQSIIQPSQLFFRTSPVSRGTPRFLREHTILPPLCYCATVDALRSLGGAVHVFFADEEGDPFAVELAGRIEGYVTGRDSDYVILNSGGYAGYIPMDQMVWSVASQESEEGSHAGDDTGFVVARKSKTRGQSNDAYNQYQGIVPPEVTRKLSLSCVVYSPPNLATHFQIPISLLPLLAALIGNDFTADRRPVNNLFFERHMTVSQRIARVANALKSVAAIASGASTKKKVRRQITTVVDFVDLTVESLLVRPDSLASGERDSIVEKTVQAALQYAIPKRQAGDEEPELPTLPCALHDAKSCPLVAFLSRPPSEETLEDEPEARKHVRSLYISAYRRGLLSPRLMDTLSTGTAWPKLFLENPDVESVPRSLGRPIREWVYALLDDGIGLIEDDVGPEENGEDKSDADEESDQEEVVDVVEEDSDQDSDASNPLAPLQGALKELSIGSRPPPSTSSHTTSSHTSRPKYVIEHVRRGTRFVDEPVRVPPLITLLSSRGITLDLEEDPDALPVQLQDEGFRLAVFLRALGSDTTLVKSLPSEHMMVVVALRWIATRLATRADEARPSPDREKEKWTVKEAHAFLASFAWPSTPGNDSEPPEEANPSIENRSIQLTAQALATIDAIEMLSQTLLLTDRIPNPARLFSGKSFHRFLLGSSTPGLYLPPGLWDACVGGLESAFVSDKSGKKDRKARSKQSNLHVSSAPTVRRTLGQGNFDVLSGLAEGAL